MGALGGERVIREVSEDFGFVFLVGLTGCKLYDWAPIFFLKKANVMRLLRLHNASYVVIDHSWELCGQTTALFYMTVQTLF